MGTTSLHLSAEQRARFDSLRSRLLSGSGWRLPAGEFREYLDLLAAIRAASGSATESCG